jgi:small neutral amino acid transporter SnatA (MarC family)
VIKKEAYIPMNLHLLTIFIGIFLVVNPWSVLPIFRGMLQKGMIQEACRTVVHACLIGSSLAMGLAYIGIHLLDVLKITSEGFRIFAGIFMGIYGARKCLGSGGIGEESIPRLDTHQKISVFLGMRMVGPGGLLMIMAQLSEVSDGYGALGVASMVLVCFSLLGMFLCLEPVVVHLKGQSLYLCSVFFGIFLGAFGVQMACDAMIQTYVERLNGTNQIVPESSDSQSFEETDLSSFHDSEKEEFSDQMDLYGWGYSKNRGEVESFEYSQDVCATDHLSV